MDHIQQKFNAIVNAAAINSPDVRAVAQAFFNLGISVALGDEPQKLCALLKTQEPAVALFKTTYSGMRANQNIENNVYSQQELQFLSHILRSILNEFESHALAAKRACNYYWDRSVPGQDDEDFQKLNAWRTNLREIQHHKKKLSTLQVKTKKQLRKHV